MSTLTKQIIEGIEGRIESVLPDYRKLRYYYDVEKNDYKGNDERFAVIPMGVESQEGVIRSITVNQDFQIVLTDGYRNGPKDDENLQDKIKALYDKMDDVLNDLFINKLGVPTIVLLSTLSGFDEPEILEENKVAVLRMNIIVRYRRSIGA